jgi:1-deoxy-D-xylulose-5-phosphate reductoisomerase
VFNAANEQAVIAFHAGAIGYLDILDVVRAAIDEHTPEPELTLESVLQAETTARARADQLIVRLSS